MSKIKRVKKDIKKNKNYKLYKSIFKNKQIRFYLTKLSIIFNSSLSIGELSKLENSLLNKQTQVVFVDSLLNLSKTFDSKFCNLNWDSLGVVFWYSFQTSLYYNKKRKAECIFTEENYIELNSIKREKFSEWLESFYDLKYLDFNSYVIKVLEVIL